MTKLWASSILLLIAMFFIPVILLRGPSAEPQKEEKKVDASCPIDITVVGLDEPLALEEYVKGVVAGEMPIGFHPEALKAQSIAARTYALKTTNYGEIPIARDVSAQVYKSQAERKKQWGKKFKENEKKLASAVAATTGDVLLYNDELISAMFFSTSNGRTETAENFSGSDVPYLQSVDSPGDMKVAPTFEVKLELPLNKWNEALGIEWNADMFKSLQLVRNPTGRVQRVATDGFESNGREIREILGLRSTDFDIAFDVTNEIVIIKTLGFGHGVGMSQYGAEAFAQDGWTADKIVQHYYTGTVIKNLINLENVCLKAP
jgi:stage II sporulation protein D